MIARIVLAVTLAACVACVAPPQGIERRPGVPYGALVDHGFAIAPVPAGKVPRKFMRQVVPYGTYAPGTIVVDPAKRFVYFVMPSGRALRYGVSVGVGAFGWSGEAVVGRKEVWPRWARTRATEPARSPRPLSLPGRPRHPVSPAWHKRVVGHRQGRLVGMHPPAEPGYDRPLRSRAGRGEGRRAAGRHNSATSVKTNNAHGHIVAAQPSTISVWTISVWLSFAGK